MALPLHRKGKSRSGGRRIKNVVCINGESGPLSMLILDTEDK